MGPEVFVALAGSLAVLAVAIFLVRAERLRRTRLAQELEAARAEVGALAQRLDEVSAQVTDSGRQRREREYVVTTLADLDNADVAPAGASRSRVVPTVADLAQAAVGDVEGRLVGALAIQQQNGSVVRRGAVGTAVKAVAFAHGVRRALRPEVRDRAAAEAYVARRRSRRLRREEIREARRLLRVVRTREVSSEDAA